MDDIGKVDFTLTSVGEGVFRRFALIDKHGNEFPGLISIRLVEDSPNSIPRYLIETSAKIVSDYG